MVSLYACRRRRICSVIRVKNLQIVSTKNILHRGEERTQEGSLRGYEDMTHVAGDFGIRR
jgi:hypothetical protein